MAKPSYLGIMNNELLAIFPKYSNAEVMELDLKKTQAKTVSKNVEAMP
jgi:septum formation topological specificity factor MinE